MTLAQLLEETKNGAHTKKIELYEGHFTHIRIFDGMYRFTGSGGSRYRKLDERMAEKVVS